MEKRIKSKITVTVTSETLDFINWFCDEYAETKSGLIEKYFRQLKKKYQAEHSALNQLGEAILGTKDNKIELRNKEMLGHE